MSQLETLLDDNGEFIWIGTVFLIVLLTAVTSFVGKRMIDRIEKRSEKTHNLWDDALVHALRQPVRLAIWMTGLLLAAEVAFTGHATAGNQATVDTATQIIHNIRSIGIIIAVTWGGLRFIKAVERSVTKGEVMTKLSLDRMTLTAIARLLRVTVLITSCLIIMQSLGFSISGVLAFGGIGGMAVGFAAKDMLANFFGALMVYLDRPFAVGDWVRSPDKSIEGTVEDIGWRLTRIRTFDKRPLYVPNSVFASVVVENPSRMTHRRIYETIGVRYDDMAQVNAITQDVEAMLRGHNDIATDQTLMVHLNQFGPSSVDFFIYTFTKTTDWVEFHGIKQDILLKIAEIIASHGGDIAYPTTTIHLADDKGESLETSGLISDSKAASSRSGGAKKAAKKTGTKV